MRVCVTVRTKVLYISCVCYSSIAVVRGTRCTCTRVSKFKFLKKQNFIHKLKVDVDP